MLYAGIWIYSKVSPSAMCPYAISMREYLTNIPYQTTKKRAWWGRSGLLYLGLPSCERLYKVAAISRQLASSQRTKSNEFQEIQNQD